MIQKRRARRLRILVVMNQMVRGYAGGDFHAVQVLNRWSRNNDVELLLPAGTSAQLVDLVAPTVRIRGTSFGTPPTSPVRLMFGYVLRMLVATVHVLRRPGSWDIVIASSHYPFDVVPVLASRGASVRAVYWHHHFVARRRPRWLRILLATLEKATATALRARSAIVFTVNDDTRNHLLRFAIPASSALLTTNSSSLVDGDDLDDGERRMFERLDGKFLLYCARISRLKGSGELVRLIPAVLAALPDVSIVIAGDGPDMPEVRKVAERPEVAARVLLPGFVSERAKAWLFRHAHAVVAPSYEEGWGISVCDALVSGCPIVAYGLPAVRAAFPEGPTYVPVGAVGPLIAETVRLLERPLGDRLRLGRPLASWDQVATSEIDRLTAALQDVPAKPTPERSVPTPPNAEPARVFLLTSHPIAPPWNSGDKSLARNLLVSPGDVSYTFLADRPVHDAEWLDQHSPFRIPGRSSMWEGSIPKSREKIRVYLGLLAQRPTVDLVHVMMTFRGGSLPERALLAVPWVRDRPLVVTCLTSANLPHRLLRQAAAVVTITDRTRCLLEKRGLRSVHTIRPGVDLHSFRPRPRAEHQRRLGVAPGEYLLFAGHHDPGGGVVRALEFAAALRDSVPRVRVLLAMRSRPGQDRTRLNQALAERIGRLGMTSFVENLGPMADMPSAIGAATAVIFEPDDMSLKMELPLTLLEALASGRPVVASPLPSLLELAGDPRAVTITQPDRGAAIQFVKRLVTHEEFFAECSSAARRLAEARYDLVAMAAAYARLYEEVLERAQGGSELMEVGG